MNSCVLIHVAAHPSPFPPVGPSTESQLGLEGFLVLAFSIRVHGALTLLLYQRSQHAARTHSPFESRHPSAATILNSLHHVPSATLQDALPTEVGQIVSDTGIPIGTDNSETYARCELRIDDADAPIDACGLEKSLEVVGLTETTGLLRPLQVRCDGRIVFILYELHHLVEATGRQIGHPRPSETIPMRSGPERLHMYGPDIGDQRDSSPYQNGAPLVGADIRPREQRSKLNNRDASVGLFPCP